MEINVDNIDKKKKEQEENIKKIKKNEERKEIKFNKIVSKVPINASNYVKDDTTIKRNYTPLEWVDNMETACFKVMSLPAGDDMEEMEQRLRQSCDMNELVKGNVIFDNIIKYVKPQYLYGLTYASILADVKMKNRYTKKKVDIEINKPVNNKPDIVPANSDEDEPFTIKNLKK